MKYLLILLILSGCYNARKSYKQVQRAMTTYPVQTASQLRETWPCVTTGTTTTTKTDTIENIISVECPDSGTVIVRVDTLETSYVQTKIVRVPVKSTHRVDTVFTRIEDSAKIFVLTDENQAKDSIIDERDRTIQDLNMKVDKRGKVNLWLAVALAASAFLIFILLRRGK